MTGETPKPCCPHCGEPLAPFQLPDNTGWDSPIHFACFNDECPYFRRGWAWMFDNYGVKSSYRYRIDPVSGTDSPLPVWSKDAIKDRILDAEISAEKAGDDLSREKTGNRGPGTGDRAPAHPKKAKEPTAAPRGATARPRKSKERAGATPPRKGKAS
jgi:hypothetical protein